MDLENVLCSKVTMKILKLLYKMGQLNTSNMSRRLGVNYELIMNHLTLLEKEGVVACRLSGRTRFFRFTDTLKARAILRVLEEWDRRAS
jgi:predicted transcriptional regulator